MAWLPADAEADAEDEACEDLAAAPVDEATDEEPLTLLSKVAMYNLMIHISHDDKRATLAENKTLTGLMQRSSRSISLEIKDTRIGPCVGFALSNTHPVFAGFKIVQGINLQ